MKIYTKKGDNGFTSLVGGTIVPKCDPHLDVYGTLDELNAFIGLAISVVSDSTEEIGALLEKIQCQLFTVAGIIATPIEQWEKFWNPEEVTQYVLFLECHLDAIDENLDPQKSFILPRGSQLIALLHICRTICRRAERNLYRLDTESLCFKQIYQYFNRLSDFFYILARYAHKLQCVDESVWKPMK